MIKVIITGRRRAGLSRAELARHLLHVHGPMVVSPPPDAGPMPVDYVQNHVVDGSYPDADGAIDRDFVTELWFDSPRHAGESVQTPYYRGTLQPDEPNFVQQSSVLRCFARETVLLDGAAPGRRKAFLFWRPAAGDPAFHDAWRDAQAAVLASDAAGPVRRWVANATSAMPGQALPFEGVDALWFEGSADGPAQVAALMRALFGAHADASGAFHLVADEHPAAAIRALHA